MRACGTDLRRGLRPRRAFGATTDEQKKKSFTTREKKRTKKKLDQASATATLKNGDEVRTELVQPLDIRHPLAHDDGTADVSDMLVAIVGEEKSHEERTKQSPCWLSKT